MIIIFFDRLWWWSYDNDGQVIIKLRDAMLGVEFSLGQNETSPLLWYNPWVGILSTLMTLDNMYFNFDIGYGWTDNYFETDDERLGGW